MHLLNLTVICTLTLFSFACANIPESRTGEEKSIIFLEPKTSADSRTAEELESFSFNALECIQAFLTGGKFTSLGKNRSSLIFLCPPETEPSLQKQGENINASYRANLLQTKAVNLVVGDSVFTLLENREKILQLITQSGADFFLQSKIIGEEEKTLGKLNLYKIQDLAIVYSDTRRLLVIKK